MSNTIAKVVDTETGEALPPGAQGELCVSGPQVGMQKYHEFYVTITHYLNLLGRSCFWFEPVPKSWLNLEFR